MQQLTSLIESGDIEAAKQLIKDQLNESTVVQQLHHYSIKNGKSFIDFDFLSNGTLSVTSVDTDTDGEKSTVNVEIKKVDLKALLEFLQTDERAKSAMGESK